MILCLNAWRGMHVRVCERVCAHVCDEIVVGDTSSSNDSFSPPYQAAALTILLY